MINETDALAAHASTFEAVTVARDEARQKAWDRLARYKFDGFGYWASAWVKFNQLLPREHRQPNPFRGRVQAARLPSPDAGLDG